MIRLGSSQMQTKENRMNEIKSPRDAEFLARQVWSEEVEITGEKLMELAEAWRKELRELVEALDSMPAPEVPSGFSHLSEDWIEWDNRRMSMIDKYGRG